MMKWEGCWSQSHKNAVSPSNIQYPSIMIKSFDLSGAKKWPEGPTQPYTLHVGNCPSPVLLTISLNPYSNPIRQERPIQDLLTIDKSKTETWGNVPEWTSSRVETRIKVSWFLASWRCVVKKFRPQILSITPHSSPWIVSMKEKTMYRTANPTLRNCLIFLPVPVPPQKNAICLRCFPTRERSLMNLGERRDADKKAFEAACVRELGPIWPSWKRAPGPPGKGIKFSWWTHDISYSSLLLSNSPREAGGNLGNQSRASVERPEITHHHLDEHLLPLLGTASCLVTAVDYLITFSHYTTEKKKKTLKLKLDQRAG